MEEIIAHPVELRERAIAAFRRKEGGVREVAEAFDVGSASLTRWLRLVRENGSVEPKPYGGGRQSKITSEAEELLKRYLKQNSDAIIPDLVKLLKNELGIDTSIRAVGRALARLGITRKKRLFTPRNETVTE